jgi:hypothetical protein
MLERKITLVTEDLATNRYCEAVLKDRNRLSKENALTICEYLIAMKREVNPRLSYKKNTIQFLYELSKAVGIGKKFIDMTRGDILCYQKLTSSSSRRSISKCKYMTLIGIGSFMPLQKCKKESNK